MRHVAVLGTGIMGAGMARSLLRSGLDVTVWNRSSGRAGPLAADGAHVAGTAAEAVAGVDAVVTMLWDGDSVAEVMTAALPSAPTGVLWVQTSTVSLRDAGDRLPALAARHGARYGTRLKLVANSWVATIVAATAQAIALAQDLGLDPQVFLDMIKGGGVDTPYLHVKGGAMIAGQFPTSFAVDGAVKDTALIAAAMREAGTDATLMDAVNQQYRKAADSGHGQEDMAAVHVAFRR